MSAEFSRGAQHHTIEVGRLHDKETPKIRAGQDGAGI